MSAPMDASPAGAISPRPAATSTWPEPRPGGIAGVTHLLDPYPTEIHVFLSLWMGKPLYVMTGPETVWIVDQGKIRRSKGR